jgi:hypothetical protein
MHFVKSKDQDRLSVHADHRMSAGSEGRLPTFLIIGAMKAGTTSLYHYLRTHPQIYLPEEKEVRFFDPRHRWDRGADWYARQFAPAPPTAIALGEASTSYTKYPVVQGVPERIASVVPNIRLIYILRHPVDRMRSDYLYRLSRRKERHPIESAFADDSSYFDTSRYAMQIEQYLPHFSLDRFLFIDSRDLSNKRAETLRTIYAFLGVDEDWQSPVAGHEFFRTSELRMERALTQRLYRVPGVGAMEKRLPESVRVLARRLFFDRLDVDRARISDHAREKLEQAFAGDVRRLRAFLPASFDGWGIA